VYGNQLMTSSVHAVNTGGMLCSFASVFENLQQYESLNPTCVSSDQSKVSCDHLPSDDVDNDNDNNAPVRHYVPFWSNALEYDSALELGVTQLEGGCNREGTRPQDAPDAQNTEDEICLNYGGCHISHSSPGEFLVYRFAHDNNYAIDGTVRIDVSVRVASGTQKEFRLELLYNDQVETSKSFFAPGLGYREYTTIVWENVPLRASEETHSIRFRFVNGNINFCAIGVDYRGGPIVTPSTPAPTSKQPLPTLAPTSQPLSTPKPTGSTPAAVPPITWGALEYYEGFDQTPDASTGGCNVREDGIDAQQTTDTTCIQRDNSRCNIAWWDPDEFLIYRFSIPSGGSGAYDIRVRAASNRYGRQLGMELSTIDGTPWDSKSFNVPGDGYQSFSDITWGSVNLDPNTYSLKVYSATGRVNLCSTAILPAQGGSGPDNDPDPDDEFKVVVPGHYSAMYYTDASTDATSDNIGNCPYRKDMPVDAKLNNDSVCKQATTEFDQHCHIAFTDRNEALFYDIKKAAGQSSINVSIRVASSRKRKVRVQLYSESMTLKATKDIETPGRLSWTVYDTLPVWNQIDVGTDEVFKMKIEFLDGQVNLCSFFIE
jgi:hypothetical protein